MTQTALTRPELTLPEAEAALLRAAYGRAEVVLEYGSGGSTVMAGELPGRTVFSVESDPDWAAMMRAWFAANPPATGTQVHVVHADIGATKEWGHPVDDSAWRRFARYPLGVWSREDFRQPDVVLVDGRFRQGCALATAFLTQRPVDLFFDDYVGRKHYHKVEEILGPPQITGRMAQFRVAPTPVPPERLAWLIKLMQAP
ncbi:hypothetical protein [Pseudoponticoccus marisrubri]|uniref:Methyltransferase n=1 Tax=Pseudoponticoccus marisrubri TaxID=1685382 RepID=A0A0W7WLI6_9RHOB|nr:hypothetical protein [Pseudoponticoccus marisrubri]KUF11458.1 hypothetical protein AVJ23_06745 [Pseudoponticoccus marisrubri]